MTMRFNGFFLCMSQPLLRDLLSSSLLQRFSFPLLRISLVHITEWTAHAYYVVALLGASFTQYVPPMQTGRIKIKNGLY